MATVWRAVWSGTWWEYVLDSGRTLTVSAEIRTFVVDVEDRTVEVT